MTEPKNRAAESGEANRQRPIFVVGRPMPGEPLEVFIERFLDALELPTLNDDESDEPAGSRATWTIQRMAHCHRRVRP